VIGNQKEVIAMTQVFIPPLLVDERDDQGWYNWVAAQMEDVRDIKTNQAFSMPGIKSKSGQAIVHHAMEWAQYKAMQRAVDGGLQTEAGRAVREYVLAGSLISLMPIFSTEIYRSFVPVWRSLGHGRYEVGYEDPVQEYAAPSASIAYVKAQEWYNVKRQGEIDANSHRPVRAGHCGYPPATARCDLRVSRILRPRS
jgi:hypothetical protein